MGFFTEAYYMSVLTKRTFFPRRDFKAESVPDLSARVIIVTGGNVGIGRETIKVLLQRNAKVYMASRNRDKAEAAIKRLKDETGQDAIFLELDLSSLASVRKAASEFLSKEPELHVLFNNAGVMGPPIDELTAEGFDLQFGTNVIGHFLFTELLMPALLAGAQSSPDHHARVITTSSSTAMYGKIDFGSVREGSARRRYSQDALYAQSKLANAIVAHQAAKRYGGKGIVSISVDPGCIATELQRYSLSLPGLRGPKQGHRTSPSASSLSEWSLTMIDDNGTQQMEHELNTYDEFLVQHTATHWQATLLLRPAPFGALTQLWAGTTPEAIEHNGKYAIPTARIGPCRAEAYDDELGQKMWTFLENSVKEA
ncbi:NAD-P-binding protein [Fomitopsis serialis]|uniref:NAD-P-binding protein n=1 Tax=Fomitopsis serialis TaxID=139415 RepID=UPI002007A092|nr:NAD-P-binding protein [Neoantrodia serialis]KAH9929182.1 NAD-P-binding protein [Neoantrodia serialis]